MARQVDLENNEELQKLRSHHPREADAAVVLWERCGVNPIMAVRIVHQQQHEKTTDERRVRVLNEAIRMVAEGIATLHMEGDTIHIEMC